MLPRVARLMTVVSSLVVLLSPAAAIDPDRDFSGVWYLDEQKSEVAGLPSAAPVQLSVSQEVSTIRCTESDKDGKSAVWTYHIDSTVSKYQIGNAHMSSQTKWEGTAFLIDTIVTGSQNYVITDRWKLSRDHHTLTIRRQIQRGAGAEAEAVLVYRNQYPNPVDPDKPAGQPSIPNPAGSPAGAASQPPQTEIVVPAGTKIPLTLINSLSTKHSSDGDRVYLQTSFPIVVDGRIVIPRGSYVTGTVTEAKRPGKVKGKGEIFLRFDSLTLANGTTRDFRSRLGSTDAGEGQFDRAEGKIKGDGSKGKDARTVATTTGAGASVGAIAGSAAGHGGMGAGIGAAAGAAAGLAAVMLSRGSDLVLPRGTSFEMVLDRDVRYKPAEIP
jgi:hypothetical protein